MILAQNWQPADGLILEPNAFKAVIEQDRCLALTAGPGAGKTEMLAQRADFLLRTGTCRYPKRILAISFKVDACLNLKERVKKRCGSDLASRFDSFTFHAFAKRIIDKFRPVLTGKDALDFNYTIGKSRISRKTIEFDDLVPLAIQILKTSKVARNAVQMTYSDVFLDEFQDCTNKQYELIQIAFKGTAKRLTAVGDTKQKIMGWAGALEGIFATFAFDFNATPLNMYRNFRSAANLLRLQNEIIKKLDPASVMPEEMIVGTLGDIDVLHCSDSQTEAENLAQLISKWINQDNIPPSEIAVLVSKQIDLYAGLLMVELEKINIPYRNEQQLQDFSVEPLSMLIVDYLLSVYGAREPAAWLRLMDRIYPFLEIEPQDEDRQNWNTFIKSERKLAAYDLIINKSKGWEAFVRTFLNKVGRDNLRALSADYEADGRMLEVFQDTISKINECMQLESDILLALERLSDKESVRILTIHKSKGLEFDSVIILGVENQTFWGNADDNRCAFFVGVSRAKHRLLLTHVEKRLRPTGFTKRWDENRNPEAEYIGYTDRFTL